MAVSVFQVRTRTEIAAACRRILESFADVLPAQMGARILLKPNLNSHMNALTGNTTDLRVLAGMLGALRERGYANLAVGEGTNSGFYRNEISVIDRLKVRELASAFEARVIDLNHTEGIEIAYENGARPKVSREVLDADLLVNLPKLKTHFEAGLTACLKNLMGTLVGQTHKKMTHQSLAANILNLNEAVRPRLHVLDAVIAMEGLGPTRGTPRNLGLLLAGGDPFVLDLVAARVAGYAPDEVGPLALARRRGRIGDAEIAAAGAVDVPVADPPFERPNPSALARFIHSPKRQPFFFKVRAMPPFPYLAGTRLGAFLLYQSGLRQDVFVKEDALVESLRFDPGKCRNELACEAYCPLPLSLPADVGKAEKGCISCLYCAQVCPSGAISWEGTKGFLAEQERQYGDIIPAVARRQ
ncbi:MAG: DUF362 domain-containing protein [Acidobacteriota bacterium]